MSALDVTILSGFLGSGKTTLLTQYLSLDDCRDTAIIVNEVGQIDVDGAIIDVGSSVPSILLSNGCVCCSLSSSIESTIAALQSDRLARGEPPFSTIVIECSGLSRPGPIIRSLHRLPVQALRVRVVTTFDCLLGWRWLAAHEEAAAQLAAAQTIVLTKIDIAGEAACLPAADALAQLFPMARLVQEAESGPRARSAFAAVGTHEIFDVLHEPHDSSTASRVTLNHHGVRPFLIRLQPTLSWDEIAIWLDDLAGYCGDRLLRLKGVVLPWDSNDPILVQSVGTAFDTPTRLSPQKTLSHGLVVIVQHVSAADIIELAPEAVVAVGTGLGRLTPAAA